MQDLLVSEKISVLCAVIPQQPGHCPLNVHRVRWGGTDYRIREQTAHWCSREGRDIRDHLTLRTDTDDILWVIHSRLQNQWWLEKIYVM